MEGRQKGLLQRGRIRTTAVLIILVPYRGGGRMDPYR